MWHDLISDWQRWRWCQVCQVTGAGTGAGAGNLPWKNWKHPSSRMFWLPPTAKNPAVFREMKNKERLSVPTLDLQVNLQTWLSRCANATWHILFDMGMLHVCLMTSYTHSWIVLWLFPGEHHGVKCCTMPHQVIQVWPIMYITVTSVSTSQAATGLCAGAASPCKEWLRQRGHVTMLLCLWQERSKSCTFDTFASNKPRHYAPGIGSRIDSAFALWHTEVLLQTH